MRDRYSEGTAEFDCRRTRPRDAALAFARKKRFREAIWPATLQIAALAWFELARVPGCAVSLARVRAARNC